MIKVTDSIKEAYSKSTTQYDKIVINEKEYAINNVDLDDDCYEDGNIFGTAIAKALSFEIESSIDLEGKEFKYYTGIKTSVGIEWIDLGTYITQEVEPNDTTKINTVNAMDYMLKTNIKYTSDLQYSNNKITLGQVAQEACMKAGLVLATTDFPNASFIVDSNQFEDGTLIRQVISSIAQISGTVAKVKNDDKLYFITPKTTADVKKIFNLSDYSGIEIKRATHPINLISLGMSSIEGENVVMRDEESITLYGENALVINDNPFAYTEAKRQQLITAIFNSVKGFEYKAFEMTGQGLPYLETLDNIQFIDFEGKTYNSFLFRVDHKSPKGLETEMSAPSITKATVNYQNVESKEEQAIKKTERSVDKQNQIIKDLVSSNSDLVKKTSQLQIDVEGIKGEVGEIADVTATADGYGVINVENINESEPILVKIYPTAEDITPLRPRKGLYPRVGLRPHHRELIFVRTNNEEEPYSVEYNIPADLYKLDNYYDEFVLDYENQRCYINRNIGINENGEKYLLEIPTVEEFEYPILNLLEGDYKIYMPAFENAYIYVRLMTKNLYTSQFATKVELNSKIEQTSTNIELNVAKTYATKSTTDTLSSKIKQTATTVELTTTDNKTSAGITIKLKNEDGSQIDSKSANITLSGLVKFTDLSGSGTTTINGSNITTGTIDASKVTVKNLNASNITSGTLSASKISGGSLSLTGNNTTITSTNFSVTKDGVITAKSGTLGGWKIDSASISKTTGQYNLEIRSDRPANEAAILVWDTKSQGYNFYIRPDGFLYAKNADISGKISATSGVFRNCTITDSCSVPGSIISGKISGNEIDSPKMYCEDLTAFTLSADIIKIHNRYGHYGIGDWTGRTVAVNIGGQILSFVGGILIEE